MSDARLRELEREAERDPAARVRWLTERLRAGTLTRERVELAAYCGDRAAGGACDRTLGAVLVDVFEPLGLRAEADEWANALFVQLSSDPLKLMPLGLWSRGLVRWSDSTPRIGSGPASQGVLARAGVEATATCLPTWEQESVECRECGGCGLIFPQRLPRSTCSRCGGGGVEPERGPPVVSYYSAMVNACRGWIACSCDRHFLELEPFIVAAPDIRWHHGATLAANGQADLIPQAIDACAHLAGEPEVRGAISRALIAWALA